MGKQAKAKPASAKGSNSYRPNGKAWKAFHGTTPPLTTAKADSERTRSLKASGRVPTQRSKR